MSDTEFKYGFRHDPMDWVKSNASLDAALARKHVFGKPNSGDADVLQKRIDEILEHHKDRLERVTECCKTSHTIREVAGELFGDRHGYEELLAVLEAGAHVEYLNELGRLRIANLDRVEAERDPILEFVAK